VDSVQITADPSACISRHATTILVTAQPVEYIVFPITPASTFIVLLMDISSFLQACDVDLVLGICALVLCVIMIGLLFLLMYEHSKVMDRIYADRLPILEREDEESGRAPIPRLDYVSRRKSRLP